MTWTVFIATMIVCIIKVLMTCLPTGIVEKLLRKYAIHATLTEENCTISIDGKQLKGEEKRNLIHSFNEASFLEKYMIFKGYNEDVYLHPENGGTPIMINTKQGRKNIIVLVFRYNDRVDIVKQYKRKIVAYSALSDALQKKTMSV
ncbi:YfmQ family protein [Niallia sp. 01092]|uniref:YfmQ family protein n=1 Tax=unclassified Niallia TaxID=2837522 RepID=UPI003FD31669